MKTRRKLLFLSVAGILLIALLALAAQPMQVFAAPPLTLDWYATGSTGSSITSGSLNLDSSVGQSIARNPDPNLCAGFGCGLVLWWQLRLPAIYR